MLEESDGVQIRAKGKGDYPEETEEQKERNEQIMGTLRAAEKGKPKREMELQGVEVHFLNDKDTYILAMVDSETREAIRKGAAGFMEKIGITPPYYFDAEYLAVMPTNIDAAGFIDRYANGFEVSITRRIKGGYEGQETAVREICDIAAGGGLLPG